MTSNISNRIHIANKKSTQTFTGFHCTLNLKNENETLEVNKFVLHINFFKERFLNIFFQHFILFAVEAFSLSFGERIVNGFKLLLRGVSCWFAKCIKQRGNILKHYETAFRRSWCNASDNDIGDVVWGFAVLHFILCMDSRIMESRSQWKYGKRSSMKVLNNNGFFCIYRTTAWQQFYLECFLQTSQQASEGLLGFHKNYKTF